MLTLISTLPADAASIVARLHVIEATHALVVTVIGATTLLERAETA